MISSSQMGAFSLGINVGLLSKPSSDCTRISKIPISRISLCSMALGKKWSFDARKPKLRITNALASGETEARKTDNELLEKEFKFSPTFHDYVKVMESIRTDRSKKLSEDDDGHSLKKRVTIKDASRAPDNVKNEKSARLRKNSFKENIDGHEEREYREKSGFIEEKRDGVLKNVRGVGKSRERGVVENTASGWGLVEGILEKAIVARSHVRGRGKSNHRESNSEYEDGRSSYRKSTEFEENVRDGQFRKQDVGSESFSKIRKDLKRNDRYVRRADEFGNLNEEKNPTSHGKYGKLGSTMKARKTEELTSRAVKIHDRSYKNNRQSVKGVGETDVVDHVDRAAFKTFQVFTDIRNKPRVLRMELEERIEKLAKRLNAADLSMPRWQFTKMMNDSKIKYTDHSILRVIQILGTLGNWKRVLQVVEWLHSRDRFKSYKSRYIYTTVLDVLGKAKRPIEALNIFYAMRQELASYPDLATYRCIAVTLGQAGLMKELFDVIDCMRIAPEKKFNLGPLQKWDPRMEPDLVIYNAVLNACVQQKQWEGVFWVLQQLKEHGIKPSNTTYGLAMEVMLESGKYSLVHDFFRKVEKTTIPSALNYKVLVNTLWREGKIDEAVLAVHDMESRGIVGSASLYYDLARCLCSAGRCEEALQQIDMICKVAKKPLVVTYTGLIQACLDSGSIKNATFIFNQMSRFCSPNIVTCNIMLKSYLNHGMFEEANELFIEILDGSQRFDNKASSSESIIADKFTFNTMMEACATLENWDDFVIAYREMLHHGFHFDVRRHLRMILDAFRAGKRDVLETTWQHLVRSGRVPPPPIIKERLCMKLEEGDLTSAISCIRDHQELDAQALSDSSWLNYLKTNSRRFNRDVIVRLTSELGNLIREIDRPPKVYECLLRACNEFVSITENFVNFSDDPRNLSCDLSSKS